MTEREEFVLRALEPGANKAALCREYGVSRKTGYKWIERYLQRGRAGLRDMSKRPHRSPLRTSGEAVMRVLEVRADHPRWGPKKIRAVLLRSARADDEVPSIRTIARILERAGLVKKRKRRRRKTSAPSEAPSPQVEACNDLWTVDFKGWWRTGDGAKAEPLTVRDAHSRFVLCAELLERSDGEHVMVEFDRLFERYGLPNAIQVDNGSPFASTRSVAGLTRVSAWWISLGITVIRGRPAHPQDNGAHERMHLDLRYDVEDESTDTLLSQRGVIEAWRHEFNHVRPHEALDQRVPADVYERSGRPYFDPRPPRYAPGLEVRRVSPKGYIKYRGRELFVSQSLATYDIGLRSTVDGDLEAWFYNVELGRIGTLEIAS